MAIRLYLPSTGAAAVTPGYHAGWEYTTPAEAAGKLAAVLTKISSSMVTRSYDDANNTNQDICFGMWVGPPFTAQTIAAQAIAVSVRCSETAITNNMGLRIVIRVVQPDGVTYRGTLLDMTLGGVEANTSLRSLYKSTTCAELAVQTGDRPVIELGLGGDPATAGSHDSSMSFGDNSASDLAADNTDTDADNPWVEFANTLTFFDGHYTLTAAQGSFTLSGQSASLAASRKLAVAQGSFTLTGQSASLAASRRLAAAAGSFTLTGQSASLAASRRLVAGYGAFALTGYDVTFTLGGGGPTYTLTAESGSFTLSGQSASLAVSRRLAAAAGSFTLSGQSAGLAASRRLAAAAGSFTLTGYDVSFIYSGGGPTYTLTAEYGSFVLAGQAAALRAGRRLLAAYGAFALTGQSASLVVSRRLAAGYGAFALTGQDAALRAGRRLAAWYGAFALTGQDAGLVVSRRLAAAQGSFVLTWLEVVVTYSALVVGLEILHGKKRSFTLTGERSFTLEGVERGFTLTGEERAFEMDGNKRSFTLSGKDRDDG